MSINFLNKGYAQHCTTMQVIQANNNHAKRARKSSHINVYRTFMYVCMDCTASCASVLPCTACILCTFLWLWKGEVVQSKRREGSCLVVTEHIHRKWAAGPGWHKSGLKRNSVAWYASEWECNKQDFSRDPWCFFFNPEREKEWKVWPKAIDIPFISPSLCPWKLQYGCYFFFVL